MTAIYGDISFNIDSGYLEGLVRGFRSGILTRTDYLNLIQCESLEGRTLLSVSPNGISSLGQGYYYTKILIKELFQVPLSVCCHNVYQTFGEFKSLMA